MTKEQKQKVIVAFDKAIEKALTKHSQKWSIKTLDFVNANPDTTDFYIVLEKAKNIVA